MRVGVDIGGTVTDVVVFDEEQHSVALAKVLTTPAALAQGVQARAPRQVLQDVTSGYVSVEAARRDYGVVIKAQSRRYELNVAATEALRREMAGKRALVAATLVSSYVNTGYKEENPIRS